MCNDLSMQPDQVSRALRASEARFHSLVINSPDGVLVIDSDGDVRFVNPAAESLFERDQKKLVGHSFGFPLVSGETTEVDVYRRGKRTVAEMRVVEIEWEQEPAYLATLRDVSDRKRLSDELIQANQKLKYSNEDLEQFAYLASHDLQEPLRKVTTFCQLLREEYGTSLDEDANRYVEYAVDGAQRMKSLVSDLLELSRLDSDANEPAPSDANAACEKAIELLQFAIEETEAVVTCDNLPVVMSHEGHLLHLFQNLIGNAIKYRHAARRSEIHITTTLCVDQWVFSVRDNGIGIGKSYYDRIFKIFKRLHARDEYSGTGIGLSICKKIVDRSGGRIWVESEEGVGSTFFFTMAKVSLTAEDAQVGLTDIRNVACQGDEILDHK